MTPQEERYLLLLQKWISPLTILQIKIVGRTIFLLLWEDIFTHNAYGVVYNNVENYLNMTVEFYHTPGVYITQIRKYERYFNCAQ
jgi:hypothetical protein